MNKSLNVKVRYKDNWIALSHDRALHYHAILNFCLK